MQSSVSNSQLLLDFLSFVFFAVAGGCMVSWENVKFGVSAS